MQRVSGYACNNWYIELQADVRKLDFDVASVKDYFENLGSKD